GSRRRLMRHNGIRNHYDDRIERPLVKAYYGGSDFFNFRIASQYDRVIYNPQIREYYSQSDFFNFGYWREDTIHPKEACENLLEKLLASIPERQGSILDVACGLGATTAHLLRYYRPSDVVGINISHKQLETCKVNAPGCTFLQMDAAQLGFDE